MKPYPHTCPKCRNKAITPVNVSRRVVYRYDGKGYDLDIPDLPILQCGNCHFESHTNNTEERTLAAVRAKFDLLSPSEIEAQRQELGLTQRELARRIGTSEESISRWETGLVVQSRAMNKLLQVFFFVPSARAGLGSNGFRKVGEGGVSMMWASSSANLRFRSTGLQPATPSGNKLRECA